MIKRWLFALYDLVINVNFYQTEHYSPTAIAQFNFETRQTILFDESRAAAFEGDKRVEEEAEWKTKRKRDARTSKKRLNPF